MMDWKLEVVVVPIADIDRARYFYSEQVGFAIDHDTQISDSMRIVQLTPPGSACSIVLMTGNSGASPGSAQGLQLVVADIEVAHAALVAGGVAVSTIQHFDKGVQMEGRGGDWNSFVFFSDPDSNSWVVQERPAHEYQHT